ARCHAALPRLDRRHARRRRGRQELGIDSRQRRGDGPFQVRCSIL
ncbi:MAG: hypothetical protein AVDCRST_MAG58-3785, partial [uncultured Rubrobacteraceae bacterium]